MLSTVNDSTSDGDRLSSAGYGDGANDGDSVALSNGPPHSSQVAFICATLCFANL